MKEKNEVFGFVAKPYGGEHEDGKRLITWDVAGVPAVTPRRRTGALGTNPRLRVGETRAPGATKATAHGAAHLHVVLGGDVVAHRGGRVGLPTTGTRKDDGAEGAARGR